MRTWEENRRAISELWPLMEWTGEEKKLWVDDLSVLDQTLLYDAIRNVKRTRETNYPQLVWIRDEYRTLNRLSQAAARNGKPVEPRELQKVAASDDQRYRDELMEVIRMASPSDFEMIRDLIAGKAAEVKIEMATALRLINFLLQRTGRAQGGRPDAA